MLTNAQEMCHFQAKLFMKYDSNEGIMGPLLFDKALWHLGTCTKDLFASSLGS